MVISIAERAIYIVLLASIPLMAVALIVGLLVSIFQATTSIQEQTLAFVPKIVGVLVAIILFGPWMLSLMIDYFYGRAGYVYLNNGEVGSITFIGTVSPAGGNLKEPVTESTKKVARCFYGLEQNRADKKRYPAVNPIDSYSKYLEYPEFAEYIKTLIQGLRM